MKKYVLFLCITLVIALSACGKTNEGHNSKESLKEIYNSEYFITLDELSFK